MKKNILAIGIISMFIILSLIPMIIGQDIETTKIDVELEEMFNELRFMCTTPYGFSEEKYEYYKEQLLSQYSTKNSNDDLAIKLEKGDLSIPIKPLSSPVISDGPMDSAWPMKCFNTHHISQSPYSTVSTTSAEKWRFYSSGWVESGIAIDSDGTLYFKGAYNYIDRYIFAVYLNGTEKWKFETDGLILGSSPAIAEDGTIYIGSWDTKLYAINPDGTEKWRSPGTGGSIYSSPAIADDGTIYVGNYDAKIVAINPYNGTIKWYYGFGGDVSSDPAIADDGTIYIGSFDHYLYALYPGGSLRWRFPTGDAIKGPPSIAEDGTIYVGSYDTYLYAINPDGTQKWRCYIGYGIATNPSIGADGTIYVCGDKVYAVYPNGTRSWSFDIGPEGHIDSSSPAISADGTIYVGTNIGGPSDGGEIIAINPDGTEQWRKRIANKWVESSPSIAEDGTVYIGSSFAMSEGYLHAFGTVENNEPPSIPIITGPRSGNAGVKYTYAFISNDPESYPVKYYVEWGDDTHSGWTGEYGSSEEVKISHTWSDEGTYTIRAKAMDISNDESDWGTFDVTIPRSRMISIDFFIKFLQNHPNIFLIIRKILGL